MPCEELPLLVLEVLRPDDKTLPKPPHCTSNKIRAIKEGMSQRGIGEVLGVDQATVHRDQSDSNESKASVPSQEAKSGSDPNEAKGVFEDLTIRIAA